YQLYNSMGQIIWTGKNIEQQDFSNLQNGIYFLKVSTQTRHQTFKLMKQ
ncbi:MAG: T9SS type A sorting domain-containing protein, partial [Saprospiraceae bacterium]